MAGIKKTRLNDHIKASEVRLIGADGEQIGIVKLESAKEAARAVNLDLVEISPGAEPPVCRVMDYGKYLFQQRKKLAASRKKQKQQVKEIKLRPGTEESDLQVKLRSIRRFLEDGDKVKITLRFRGREVVHHNLGMELLVRISQELEDVAVVEQRPKLEGKQITMVVGPKKK